MVTLARVVLFCGSMVFTALASGEEIYIARKKGAEAESSQVVEALSRAFMKAAPGSPVKVGYSSEVKGTDRIVVAVGESALREVIEAGTGARIVSAFISKATFNSLISQYPNERARVTAVFSDPSPVRQLALIRVLLGEGSKVAVLATEANVPEVNDVSRVATTLGLRIIKGHISENSTLRGVFDDLQGSDTLLLLRDKQVFDFASLDDLIREAYDNRGMGVIGYSSIIVNNGGLGTTFSTTEDTAEAVGDVVDEIIDREEAGNDRYPSKYQISINKYVLRSLGYRLIPESEIKKEISLFLRKDTR